MENYTLECCVDSVESAIIAAENGATRLELCGNLIIGGTTPSLALFHQIRKHTNIRIHALLRPRFGDFLYSNEEFAILEQEVCQFLEAGAEGVVIGCLLPNGHLDLPRMHKLIKLAEGMSVTLHRAFDVCADPHQALKEAQELGITTILTSGQANSSLAGKEILKMLHEQSHNIEIMAGAGVDARVIQTLLRETGLRSFHMSGKIVKDSAMAFRKADVPMGLPGLSEYEIWQTAPNKVAAARDILKAYVG